jgi:hypothetical protein
MSEITLSFLSETTKNSEEITLKFRKLSARIKGECEEIEAENIKKVKELSWDLMKVAQYHVPSEVWEKVLPIVSKLEKAETENEKSIIYLEFYNLAEPFLTPIAIKKLKVDYAINLTRLLIDRRDLEGQIDKIKQLETLNNSDFWQDQYLEELNKSIEFFRVN